MAKLLWKPKGDCSLTSLGKGFLAIRFSNEEDKLKVWRGGPWKFEDQLMRITQWTPDFNPNNQINVLLSSHLVP